MKEEDKQNTQGSKGVNPEIEKQKAVWQKRIESKTREVQNWSTKLARLNSAQQMAESIMSGLQGGYADVEDGDSSGYTFQSKGPLGSQPQLDDEGFDTFYGDSDSHWGSFDFDSDGPELGEDPETLGEEKYKVNYSKTLEEKFTSKAQQKYLYATNPKAAKKLGSKMTKKDYKKLPEKKKKMKEDKQRLNEMYACNPPGMSGGEGNNCGVAGSNYDCGNGTGGTLESVMGFCLCVSPSGGTIQGGSDDGCSQGDNVTQGGGRGGEREGKRTKGGKLPQKPTIGRKKRVKELQVWGVNSNPGFGLGQVPRDSMTDYQSKSFNPTNIGPMENINPKMKKSKLLEYISELTTRSGKNGKVYKKKDLTKSSAPYITEAPIDYGDRPERINPDIERQLATQDTAFGTDHPAFPKVGDDEVYNNYEELIASKRFKDVVDTFKRYTGVEGNATDMQNLMGLQGMMMQSLQNTLRIESANKEQLENLAIDIVTRDLNVPEGSLQFDVEITGMKKLSKDDMKQKPKDKEDSFEMEEDTLEHMEELDLEVSKRRFINSMMQGSAKKALYLYHMVSDELNAIDPTLMNLYGVVISANDLMYWIMPDMMGGGGGGEGAQVFGKEKIDLSTTPPTVVAKGMTFPVLVHELHKGVMEYLSLHGLPGDKELRQKVMDKTDFLEDEMWDLRLGPGLWERFIDAIGADDFDVKNHLYSEIIQMPAKQFLEFMKEIQSGSDKGKQMMVNLAEKIKDEIQQDEYEDATGEYRDDGDDGVDVLPDPTGEDDIDINDLFPPGSGSTKQEMDIDTLLDKISDSGMESLTPEEMQFLKDQ